MRLGLALANEGPIAQTVALAQRAEQLGLAEVWVPESSHGRSVTSVAATLAARTRHIGLGVGVVNPFWRHPSLIAMEAATLDEASDGRLRMGLGAGLWTLHALGEADQRTRRPLAAMVEAIRIVRAMLRDEAGPNAEIFTVRADAALDFAPLRRQLPIYVGAVNQRMLQATGALADGAYLGAITSPGYTAWAAKQLAQGAAAGGRHGLGEMDLIANVLTSVGHDPRAARAAVKPVLAYYLWRVDGVVVDQAGADPQAVAEVRRTVAAQGVKAGAARVSDELVEVFAAAGDPEHVAARLHAYAQAGLDGALAWHVLGPDPDQGLRLLATGVRPLLQTT